MPIYYSRELPVLDLRLKNYQDLVSDFGELYVLQQPKYLIGRGAFGAVYQSKSIKDGQNYALKIRQTDEKELYNMALNEVMIF